MKVLAISGSLRAASLNTMLLRVVARLAPPGISVVLFDGLGRLPLFNPDIEAISQPEVANFQAQLLAADAVLIASPEYAHGVTGAMKNALDWMVGSEAFVNKPVALLNLSPRAVHAQASMKETLTVMSARVIEQASITLPLLGSHLEEEDIVSHLAISSMLGEVLLTLQTTLAQWHAQDECLGMAN